MNASIRDLRERQATRRIQKFTRELAEQGVPDEVIEKWAEYARTCRKHGKAVERPVTCSVVTVPGFSKVVPVERSEQLFFASLGRVDRSRT